MTSAIAIFGNESFFYIASNSTNESYPPAKAQICQQANIPFQHMTFLDYTLFQAQCYNISSTYNKEFDMGESALATLLYSWALGFNDTNTTEEALGMSMFFANQAMLTKTVDSTWAFGARAIVTAPGAIVLRPAKTIAGTVIISTLIFLQLVGIAYTVNYIYQIPIWTAALDALAVARIGASMNKEDLPPLGPVDDEDLKKLMKVDGLVGVVDESPRVAELEVAEMGGSDIGTTTGPSHAAPSFCLGRGAPGVITRRLVSGRPSRLEKRRKRKKDEKGQRNQEGHEMLELRTTNTHTSK